MSVAFQILKEGDRYALYQDGVLINTYSRKDSATRRLKKILANIHIQENNETEHFAQFMTSCSTSIPSDISLPFFISKPIFQGSVGLPYQQAQCASAHGTTGMVARSPPLG